MKTKRYAAVCETAGSIRDIIAQSGLYDSKVQAINALRSDESAARRLRRIDKVARNDQHFIQLCADSHIRVVVRWC